MNNQQRVRKHTFVHPLRSNPPISFLLNLVVSTYSHRVWRAPRLGFFFFTFFTRSRLRQHFDTVYMGTSNHFSSNT